MSAATKVPLIRVDENGVAWIEGTTAKVIEIVLTKLGDDLTPEEVQAELPHLSLAQIYAALAHYHAHKEQLDAQIEEWDRGADQLSAREINPLSRTELLARLKQPSPRKW